MNKKPLIKILYMPWGSFTAAYYSNLPDILPIIDFAERQAWELESEYFV